jgi:DNA polymerase alpha subunit B
MVDETPSDIFKRQFIALLQDFLSQSPTSTVLLVPSVNDIISDHAVFPQCELDDEFSSDPVGSSSAPSALKLIKY